LEATLKVITYGSFDLLHRGHINLLTRARSLGTHLTVGLSDDNFNQSKNKCSAMEYEDRKLILESLKMVDLVIPESSWDQKIVDVKKHSIDIFAMGDDWEGKFDFLKGYCKVVYLPRTAGISTTEIKVKVSSPIDG